MNFSEREGYKSPKQNPLGSIDSALKNDIWNELFRTIYTNYIIHGTTGYGDSSYYDNKAEMLWTKFFRKKISDLPYAGDFLRELEPLYDALEWHQVYDLTEFLLEKDYKISSDTLNEILEEHNAAYRIIHSIVQPISNKEVISVIESANNNSPNKEARQHLEQAQKLFSNKQHPDFKNSCLESIMAVEATCRHVLSNEQILGENIKELKKDDKHNKHIVSILEKLNAFRGAVLAHATKPDDAYAPDREDAILTHTICCGFINYFKSTMERKT